MIVKEFVYPICDAIVFRVKKNTVRLRSSCQYHSSHEAILDTDIRFARELPIIAPTGSSAIEKNNAAENSVFHPVPYHVLRAIWILLVISIPVEMEPGRWWPIPRKTPECLIGLGWDPGPKLIVFMPAFIQFNNINSYLMNCAGCEFDQLCVEQSRAWRSTVVLSHGLRLSAKRGRCLVMVGLTSD